MNCFILIINNNNINNWLILIKRILLIKSLNNFYLLKILYFVFEGTNFLT